MTKLKEEFFKILPPTIYFFVALHLVMFIRILMLEGTGLAPRLPFRLPLLPSFLARRVLLADMLPMINRFPYKPLIYNIAGKTVIYWLMATVITMWNILSISGGRPASLRFVCVLLYFRELN